LGVVVLFSGCISGMLFRSRENSEVVAQLHAHIRGKRFVTVAYEGVAGRDGKRQNIFRFEKAALLDRALIDQRRIVVDRALIQPVLEAQALPETGSYKEEDLARILKLSNADILIIGYSFTGQSQSMLFGAHDIGRLVLRAVDLRTRELINSVESDWNTDEDWGRLTSQLLYAD
jgi:hypothetical protein